MTAGPAAGGLPLLIIGHGTRDATGVAQFRQLIGRVRDQSAGWLPAVDGGFIELAAPSVSEVVPRLAGGKLANGGPAELVAVPLVLSAAGHGKGDIPAALAREQVRHPGLRYRYGRPLGPHPVLLDVLVLVTDKMVPVDGRTVVLRPPSLAVGVGASRGVSAAEVLSLIDMVLDGARVSPLSVAALVTVDAKANEPGIIEAAARRGWPLVSYPAAVLAAVVVPSPSAAALAAVGTPSVAEAAALTRGDVLVAGKHKSAMATAAVARIRPRGRLALVGLGPGARDLLAPRAVAELRRASVVAGLDQYLDQVRDLLRPGTRLLSSGLGAEEERARAAVTEAQRGHAVALVGSGDAGVYSMASPALSLAGEDIDVVTVPGITANLAAAALLGAPLGHDHAVISLSDLNTPWEMIERRVRAAADGDFVVTFYNPRSRARDWQLRAALDLLGAHRPASTPAAIIRNANRPGQLITVTTLGKLETAAVDMLSLVLVGCSTTQMVAGRMVTPRGYPWQP